MTNPRRAQGAGSVYARKDGRFAASASFEGKRITKYGKTKKEAWENLQAALDDLKSGRVVVGPKQTVEQYLTHWLENEHRLEIGIVSLQNYRMVLRAHLIPALGHLRLDRLTREHVQMFCSSIFDGGLAAASVRLVFAFLSAGMNHAVSTGLLAKNPCEHVILPRKVKHKPHVLNKEQANCLVVAARGSRLWFLILVAITTGARVGELLSLHWEDIDVNSMRIHIHRTVSRIRGVGKLERDRPKTASSVRHVILTVPVYQGIAEQKKYIDQVKHNAGDKWTELDLVFPNRYGKHMDDEQVRKELRVILAGAGLDSRRFHDLRHSVATLLFAAGVNPKIIQETLGHSNIATTLGLYGDVLPDMQQEVGNVMNGIFE
jgi:integrase